MNEDLKKELERLNSGIEVLGKAAQVKAVQGAPLPGTGDDGLESKGLTAKKIDEDFVDPLRQSFERLAKAAPSQFGHLGSRTVLDDPYRVIRAKNADGSYVMKTEELNQLIKGVLAMNADDPIAHGATPVEEWKQKSGNSPDTVNSAFDQAFERKSFGDMGAIVRKAVDSSTGGALIRTDIEPLLREAFVRVFPAFDLFPKIPANGIKHTWTQVTSPGSATLISELGDFSASGSNQTYGQVQSTNIAVAAAQREIGLKAMMASRQSGMNFFGSNGQPEVTGALTAIANVIQGQIFQGNESVAAKTLDDEDGLTNALGFDGLRQQLKGAGYSINKSSDTFMTALRRAVGQIYDAGANLNEIAIFCSVGANNAMDAELETAYSFLKGCSRNDAKAQSNWYLLNTPAEYAILLIPVSGSVRDWLIHRRQRA